jgi:hypothetical protein
MKAQHLIRFGIGTQLVFIMIWLFRASGVGSWLAITKDQLQDGNADGPRLELRGYGHSPSSWAYDPLKSSHENLVSRATIQLAAAESDYSSLVRVPLVLVALNLGVLVWLLILNRRATSTRHA